MWQSGYASLLLATAARALKSLLQKGAGRRWDPLAFSAGAPTRNRSKRRVNEGLWLGVSDVDDQWPSRHCLAEAGGQRQR
jgi:hypothetical protein